MRLSADSGLWSTGRLGAPTPLVAVLEVSGAVLSWVIDDASGVPSITFTDLSHADWLWRVFGEAGHSAMAAAVDGRLPDDAQAIELDSVATLPGSVDHLRRLAVGHWMRRWWPASFRDGIAALDDALLDAEIALLTSAAQDFFAEDTLDSDFAGLLAVHSEALNELVRSGDPRVIELVRKAGELTDGVDMELTEPAVAAPRRDDYALAAGAQRGQQGTSVMARGTGSLAWAGVPPGLFDAAENTVDWLVEPAVSGANVFVAVQLLGTGSPVGIAVRLKSGEFVGTGILDGRGRAGFPLVDADQGPVPESDAWNHDWRAATVTVGADVEESAQTRDRVRHYARSRLATPAGDAFLAEILAAEADY